jgi:potassium-transporting ATPase KdpC subunit
MKAFVQKMRATFGLILLLSVLLGGVYPMVVLAIAKVGFAQKAGGSLIEKDGKVVGSSLLGQEFTQPQYFWGRVSATTPAYNAMASTAANFGPSNPELLKAANARIAALQKSDPKNNAILPQELITSSASGLDPHISLLAAEYQIGRVAKARGMLPDDLQALIIEHIEPQSKLVGTPYVNVLKLNLALDALTPKKK